MSNYKISGEKAFVVEAGFSNSIDTQELEAYKIDFRDSLEDAYKANGDIVLTKYTNI